MAWSVIGAGEIRRTLGEMRRSIGAIIALSACINVLTITGSLYLMLVYDRVLPSQSLPTLFTVFAMILVAYVFYGIFDVMRSRMLADVAASLDHALAPRVQEIEARFAIERPDLREQVNPVRDLDQLRSYIASVGPPALIDLPWIVFFLAILTLVHYWLGLVTLIGMVALACLALAAERISTRHVEAVTRAGARRRTLGDRVWRHAEIIAALGMGDRLMRQWRGVHRDYLDRHAALSDASTTLTGLSKIARMVLQSVVLTVGAMLVIDGKATAGIIFASSILSARALAPVDAALSTWKNFVVARHSWARLDKLFAQAGATPAERTALPRPARSLSVEKLVLVAPGSQTVIVNAVSFTLEAGQVLGIVGPSASGKSTLVRGVLGVWQAARGDVRLDGAAIQQWAAETRGGFLGYVPQTVELFAGTIAENIARFEPDAPADAVIAAATTASVHDLIVQLPAGYETQIGEDGLALSAGQRQRVALARALYRDPFLLVLDEPNSNLDQEGESALARAVTAVKARGGIVIVVAHRRDILEVADLLLVLRGGTVQAFGPREEVLGKLAPPAPAPPPPRSPPKSPSAANVVRGNIITGIGDAAQRQRSQA